MTGISFAMLNQRPITGQHLHGNTVRGVLEASGTFRGLPMPAAAARLASSSVGLRRSENPSGPRSSEVGSLARGYPGGKNGAGVFQKIINEMPPHACFIEAFAGSGAVLRRKRPATSTIAIDRDARALRLLASLASAVPHLSLWNADALSFLEAYPFDGSELVYCDPPYLRSVRSTDDRIYRFEFSDGEHEALLQLLKRLPCAVMLRGYRSPMYQFSLTWPTWRRIDFPAGTRGGARTESLWLNFPERPERHDYRYHGDNYGKRHKFRLKISRWRAKLEAMSAADRRALLEALSDLAAPGVAMAAAAPARLAVPGDARSPIIARAGERVDRVILRDARACLADSGDGDRLAIFGDGHVAP